MLGSDDGFISVHRETRERKRKSPRSNRASKAFTPALLCGRKSCVLLHANYLASIVSRQVSGIWHPASASGICPRHAAARHGAAARRRHRWRRGSGSTPSAASRREAFTRSGADGSLDVGNAGPEGPHDRRRVAAEQRQYLRLLSESSRGRPSSCLELHLFKLAGIDQR
jgi:hypothetical protein